MGRVEANHSQTEARMLFLSRVSGYTVALIRNDSAFGERCQTDAARIRGQIVENGWDGEQARRVLCFAQMPRLFIASSLWCSFLSQVPYTPGSASLCATSFS